MTPRPLRQEEQKMFAMKPSAIRAKVITLAGRRNHDFREFRNALLMLGDGSRLTGDFKRTVKKVDLDLRYAYYLREIMDQPEAICSLQGAVRGDRLDQDPNHRTRPQQAKL
jgi:hypothetical protein